ncbi:MULTISPECIES: hypothetical protein [Pseudomonas]|uniref:hypothetical protein n=1 Tax=Pseudomonas TaxID=286 RepID=UPI0002F9EDA1|nr:MULTISPECIES: hypothetical protein [Pseudomonas]AIG00893.1 hypothetical protein HZ99_01350 [Pseudomonas fluorescens]MBJ2292630.1 hypothetical protein [Pseudomonas sp. MF5691]
MSRANVIAVGMIDARFECIRNGDTSSQLFAETSMAMEMAYALGAIDDGEFFHYKERYNRLYQTQAEAFLADIRARSAQ